MNDATTAYSEKHLSKLSAEKVLTLSGISEQDKEIIRLRFEQEWYFSEIAVHIGLKYRGKPYGEGSIRYKLKKAMEKITETVQKYNLNT